MKFKDLWLLFWGILSLFTFNPDKHVFFDLVSFLISWRNAHKDKIFKKSDVVKATNSDLSCNLVIQIVDKDGFINSNSKLILFDFPEKSFLGFMLASHNNNLSSPWFKFPLSFDCIMQSIYDRVLLKFMIWYQRVIISLTMTTAKERMMFDLIH